MDLSHQSKHEISVSTFPVSCYTSTDTDEMLLTTLENSSDKHMKSIFNNTDKGYIVDIQQHFVVPPRKQVGKQLFCLHLRQE